MALLHFHLSKNDHPTVNTAGVNEKLWDFFIRFREQGDSEAGLDSVGNKVRDSYKSFRARALAVKALTVSHGFIGTPILDCNSIYDRLKSPETGVCIKIVHFSKVDFEHHRSFNCLHTR